MKTVLLIGLGRFGRHIAMKLNDLNHEVMAVEHDEERVNSVLPFVTSALIGDSTNKDFLETLDIPSFDACIVAIGDDFQSSLETASLLKELGAHQVIARASRGVQEKFLLRNGADQVVYPEKQLAAWTAIRCTSDHILDYIELEDGYAIYELSIPENWMGKTLQQLDLRNKYGINVLGVRDGGRLNMDVTGGTLLDTETAILVLGHEKAIQKCFRI